MYVMHTQGSLKKQQKKEAVSNSNTNLVQCFRKKKVDGKN